MAVPRNRHSNARKNSKRAHHARKPVKVYVCKNCSNRCLSHRLCPHCGYYKGKLWVKEKSDEKVVSSPSEVASKEEATSEVIETGDQNS